MRARMRLTWLLSALLAVGACTSSVEPSASEAPVGCPNDQLCAGGRPAARLRADRPPGAYRGAHRAERGLDRGGHGRWHPMTWWIRTEGDCVWGAGYIDEVPPEGSFDVRPDHVQSLAGRSGSDLVITGEIISLGATSHSAPRRSAPLLPAADAHRVRRCRRDHPARGPRTGRDRAALPGPGRLLPGAARPPADRLGARSNVGHAHENLAILLTCQPRARASADPSWPPRVNRRPRPASSAPAGNLPPGCEPIDLRTPSGERIVLDGAWTEVGTAAQPMTWWIRTQGDCVWGAGQVDEVPPEGTISARAGPRPESRRSDGVRPVITGEIVWLAALPSGAPREPREVLPAADAHRRRRRGRDLTCARTANRA